MPYIHAGCINGIILCGTNYKRPSGQWNYLSLLNKLADVKVTGIYS